MSAFSSISYGIMAARRLREDNKPTEYVNVTDLTLEQCKVAGVDPVTDSDAIIPVRMVQQGRKAGGPIVGR